MLPGMYSRRMAAAAIVTPPPTTDVQVLDGYLNEYAAGTDNAVLVATYGSSGLCAYTGDIKPANYNWLLSGVASDYEIYFSYSVIQGSIPSGGPFNTWLNLASNRGVSTTRSTTGENEISISATIRPVGGGPASTGSLYFLAAKNT